VTFRTRFAPSPTGPLHLGHAYSALLAHDLARAQGGRFLLRIEDIDTQRSRPSWETQIYHDLDWLGITWDDPVIRQSDRLPAYRQALETLWRMGVLYPCTCTRRDISRALSAPQEGAATPLGPDGPVYPGTCRGRPPMGALPPAGVALRLNLGAVLDGLDGVALGFEETGRVAKSVNLAASDLPAQIGDIVMSRKDFLGSYHLSVVLDDAYQSITHVVRGADLFDATAIHVVLQKLLDLPTPIYHHHKLIRDAQGKRLAKRDDARALSKFRADGASPQDIRAMVGLPEQATRSYCVARKA